MLTDTAFSCGGLLLRCRVWHPVEMLVHTACIMTCCKTNTECYFHLFFFLKINVKILFRFLSASENGDWCRSFLEVYENFQKVRDTCCLNVRPSSGFGELWRESRRQLSGTTARMQFPGALMWWCLPCLHVSSVLGLVSADLGMAEYGKMVWEEMQEK